MQLLWPYFIFLLLLIPLLIVGYLLVLRRRRRFAVRFSSLSLVRPARPESRWRRHVPPALLLVGLASLIIALSRPVSIVTVPTAQTTIMLAIDVSGSMRSTDVQPSRIGAAESAALDFINHQKVTTQIGIVAFSGNAELVQAPTTDRDKLTAAVNRLTLGRFTAIGSGILRSIDAIAEMDPTVAPSVQVDNVTGELAGPTPTPVVKGAYAPAIIVVLTDGVSNAGPLPLDAAQQAADRGIRVYTISFGTENGQFVDPNNGPGGGGGGFRGGGGGGGSGGGGGGFGRFRAGIDVETLQKVAGLTDGKYYDAQSAEQLLNVFQSLPISLIARHQVMEITVLFTALGVALAIGAIILSLLWNSVL